MTVGSNQPLREMNNRGISLVRKVDRCIGLQTLPLSCAECLETAGASIPWSPMVCPGLYRDRFTFTYPHKIKLAMYRNNHIALGSVANGTQIVQGLWYDGRKKIMSFAGTCWAQQTKVECFCGGSITGLGYRGLKCYLSQKNVRETAREYLIIAHDHTF
jgi:hypothetical protein